MSLGSRQETLLLSLCAVLLLILTYFVIEVPEREMVSSLKKEQQLFDEKILGEMKNLQLPRVKFYFEQDKVLLNDEKIAADPEKISLFFNQLNSLAVTRRLDSFDLSEPRLKNYLGDDPVEMKFEFEKGLLNFKVGKKLEFEDGFYVLLIDKENHTGKLLVVNDTTPQTSPLPEDVFRLNPYKYERVVRALNLPLHYFEEKSILTEFDSSKVNSISFSSWRNRAFSVNLASLTTAPAAWDGLKYLPKAFNDFITNLKSLKAQMVFYNINKDLLKNQLAHIKIESGLESFFTIAVFNNYGSLDGIFVWTSLSSDKVYEIDHHSEKTLMPNLQDFWDKRPLNNANSQNDFTGLKEEFFKITFPQGGQQELKIPLGPNFLVQRLDKKKKPLPNHHAFVNLFNLLVNQPRMVSLLEDNELDDLKNSIFQLDYNQTPLYLTKLERSLVFIDPQRKLKFHYEDEQLNQSIAYSFTDYFFL